MQQLYSLTVENKLKTQEEGFFFKASPFEMSSGTNRFTFLFEHDESHEAVLNIYQEGQKLLSVEHPFYLPDEAPENFFDSKQDKKAHLLIIHALLTLNIATLKSYEDYFEQQSESISYKIVQNSFYEVESK